MDYQSNSAIQRAMRKLMLIIFFWFLLEIGAFVGVSYLIGGWNAFWLTIFIAIVGYAIRPSSLPGHPMTIATSARKLISTLLMIPGFLTDIVALIVIIGPVRRALVALLTLKLMPKSLTEAFSPTNGAKFADFMKDFNARTPNAQPQPHRDAHGDVIDIDYEVKNKPDAETTVSTSRPSSTPKAIAEQEIIDVDHEWKD